VAAAALLHEELEDEGFAGACGSVDDDIPPRLEMTHRLLLPEVGNLQGDFKTVTYFEVNRHWRRIVWGFWRKANSSCRKVAENCDGEVKKRFTAKDTKSTKEEERKKRIIHRFHRFLSEEWWGRGKERGFDRINRMDRIRIRESVMAV
jgi:hypothetical protein